MRRVSELCRLAVPAVAMPLAAIGAIAVPARPAQLAPPATVTSFTIQGYLFGVAATSASNAWAVGFTGKAGKTLILRWNGTRWSQVTNPEPVYGALQAVAAVSADNVWAVGYTSTPAFTNVKTLVMHWNGRRWSVQASAPVVKGLLDSVAAAGNSVWAAGGTNGSPALLLHETGNRWYVVPSEESADSQLWSVAVTGDGTAWAAGYTFLDTGSRGGYRGLVLRWNGTIWQPVSSPLHAANNDLQGLAAGPAGAVWAVGADWNSKLTLPTAASMLWNGRTWRKMPVGPFSSSSWLGGVTFVPGGTAWAVGWTGAGALIVRWTGRSWTPVANPDGDKKNSALYGVAATSASNAWAVGDAYPGSQSETLILHWNGKTWS